METHEGGLSMKLGLMAAEASLFSIRVKPGDSVFRDALYIHTYIDTYPTLYLRVPS
jgi:hypothetical protein